MGGHTVGGKKALETNIETNMRHKKRDNKYITEKHAFRIFCATNLLLNGARHYLGITIEYRPRNYLQTYSQTCANVNYHLHVYTEMLAYVLEN